MTHAFYTIGLIFLFISILKILGLSPFQTLTKQLVAINGLPKEKIADKVLPILPKIIGLMIYFFFYIFWIFIGFFSSQYLLFFLLFSQIFILSKFSKKLQSQRWILNIIGYLYDIVLFIILNNYFEFTKNYF